VVVFDANQVDQPWTPPERHGAREPTAIRPGPSSGKVVSTVAHTAGPGDAVETVAVGVVHIAGPADAPDTIGGTPTIGSRIGEALSPDALYSPGSKRLPQIIKAQTTARVGAPDWRRDGSLADGDADWTRAQVAQGHHRTLDSRWCVRTAVDQIRKPSQGLTPVTSSEFPYPAAAPLCLTRVKFPGTKVFSLFV
jgi:hypothetical protein